MKTPTLAFVAIVSFAGPLWAGSAKTPIPPPAPVSSPAWDWFIGASGGYLFDFEEPIYTAHIGVDTPYRIGSWDTAIYLEVGYTEKDDSFEVFVPQLEDDFVSDTDVSIVPLTLNLKLERQLTQRLNVYIGAGLGVSFIDADAEAIPLVSGSLSKNDTVFTAQIFAGLIYNFTPNLEAFGGGRWLHIDAPHYSIAGHDILDLENDTMVELGLRYTF
ncbi:MAG TPA: outer membrane beta-barrel protein [Luteolibacter sp.]